MKNLVGIQYKVDNSQFSSFFGIFSDDMNDLWFAKMSSFSKLVFLEGIPEFLEIPNSSYCSFGVNQQSFTSFLYFILDTKISEESIRRQVYSRFFYLFNKSTIYNYDWNCACSQRRTTIILKVYQSSWKYQILHIARLALINNHSLHFSFLFSKPYFLWFFEYFHAAYLFEIPRACKRRINT
jgi:hypothetical protein